MRKISAFARSDPPLAANSLGDQKALGVGVGIGCIGTSCTS